MNSKTGILYIVATPIGNLGDISERAREILAQVRLILAEDTRHAAKLLSACGISTPTRAYHDHNEREQAPVIVRMLESGQDIALVSDAGTPLISDPGYRLVREARQQGITVSPIPGPCAVTAALSASGLATDRFCFEGFLAARQSQRRATLLKLAGEGRTMVFYESSHRISESLADMAHCFGGQREAALGREISKKFETFFFGTLSSAGAFVDSDKNQQKGEFVVMVAGAADQDENWARACKLADVLGHDLPLKQACKIAADTFAVSKNQLYQRAIDV